MPTYEYRCEKCAHQYEKREGFDAPSRQECPKCSGVARRIYHAPPIVFKGSGFYNTDNKRVVRSDTPKTESDSTSSAGGDGGGASESKSAETKASEPATAE